MGKHTFSFGGSAIRGQVLLRNQFRTSGSYSFTADMTNDALASFCSDMSVHLRKGSVNSKTTS